MATDKDLQALLGTYPGEIRRFAGLLQQGAISPPAAKGLIDGRPFGIVTPEEFGAKGDGVTDDTEAIQAAMNTAVSLGVTLIVPNKDYLISSALTIPDGPFRLVSNGGVIKLKSNTESRMFNFVLRNNIAIEGLTLDGQRASQIDVGSGTTQPLVYIERSSGIRFDKCTFRNGITNMIYLTGTSAEKVENVRFTDCDFENAGHDMVVIRRYAKGVRFSKCFFETWGNGILSYKGVTVQASEDVVFSGCRFTNYTSNADAGIVLEWDAILPVGERETDGATISECYFEGMHYSGIKLDDSRNITIQNCIVNKTSQGAPNIGMGIWIAGVINLVINSCIIKDINSSGIYVVKGGDTLRNSENVRIENNSISSCLSIGVYADSVDGIKIEGNLIRDCGRSVKVSDGSLSISDKVYERNNIFKNNTNQRLINVTGSEKQVGDLLMQYSSEIPTAGLFNRKHIVWNDSPLGGGTVGWVNTRTGRAAPTWLASTAYAVGDYVVPTTDNAHVYKCTVAGTSGLTEPTWPTGAGATVVDGGVTWQEDGTAALFKGFGTIEA